MDGCAEIELEMLMKNIPGAVSKMRYENGLIIEYSNDALFDLLDMSREEFARQYDNHYERIIVDEDWKKLQINIEHAIATKEKLVCEYRVKSGKRANEWRSIYASVVAEQEGAPILQCFIADITDHKHTQQEFEKEQEKLRTIVNMFSDMIFEYDIKQDYMQYTNMEKDVAFSLETTENYIQHLQNIIKVEDSSDGQRLVDAMRSGEESFNLEVQRIGKDGNYHWVLVTGKTIYDSEHNPERVIGRIENIDERKKKEKELRDKTERDSLTGLYNHKTAKDMIAERMKNVKEGESAYLFIGDIDNFKKVNDTNGHMFGDAVLCFFADEASFLFPDAIKGRIGGDEFIFYVEHMEREELEQRLQQLNASMSNYYDESKNIQNVSCSIGVVMINSGLRDFTAAFQWADNALYKVKERGKGSYQIIDANNYMHMPRKSYLESDKNHAEYENREALVSNEDELVLFCVELLENIPNLTSALKMICERTCSFYGLDDMVFVEHKGKQNDILYQWSRVDKKEYTQNMYEEGVYDLARLREQVDEQGVVIFHEEHRQKAQMGQAKTALLVLPKEIRDYNGSIIFTSRREDRSWDDIRDTLIRIANQIFSHLRSRKYEELRREESDRKLHHDALTGLPVYDYFVNLMTKYMEEKSKKGLYCVYSDFSNFQYMNEVYGYEAGDEVLCEFAEELRRYKAGVLFCRVTADHFLGMVKADSLEQAQEDYLEFTNAFSTNICRRYGKSNLVIASGIYEVQEGDTKIAAMMDNANEARKKCKEQKVRTLVVPFTEEIQKEAEIVKSIVTNMVNAYNNKEFCAYLQPKVSVTTGKIVGAEALVRWIREDGTCVMPGQFIDVFEANGFITKVDFAVLEQVMEYLQEAQQMGEEVVPVSVNFSRRHSEFPDFVSSIDKRLQYYNVPAEMLEAELTESVFLSDFNDLRQKLEQMHEKGIKISVDDFGSGYSSLNLLPKVDVDIIKLDRQFLNNTQNATQEKNAMILIKYLIKMLKKLGFQVLAEGVETKEQLDMLKKAECDMVQGYYYAKPMPISEFRAFLKEFNKSNTEEV